MRTMRILAVAVVAAILFAAPLTLAQKLDRDDGRSASRIASQFTRLAGSDDNALALVSALRAGERVTLVSGAEGERLPVTTTFELPTGPMDWDNVVISLALARDSLARAGIAQPSAEELEAALLGGDVRTARGTVRLTGALTK